MADAVSLQLHNALNTLISIKEKSGNLREDLKRDIVDSVSTLKNIFVNLKNSAEEHKGKIILLESEVEKVKAELQESRAVNLSARVPPSMGVTGNTPTTNVKQVRTSSGGAKKLYTEVTNASTEKCYKLVVKSTSNQSSESIKNVLKTKINPTEMKIGIKTLKSLKDERVLTEVRSEDETNLLNTNISAKCGEALEVNLPKLRKPRLVIRNIPQDITVENVKETILAQNPELNMKPGEVISSFKFRTKRGDTNMVTEVGPETRKKLPQTRLKIGWLICNVGDYLVAKRRFKCSRYRVTQKTGTFEKPNKN